MVNKCSVGNCTSNYDSKRGKNWKYIPVYQLPTDPDERQLWIDALPNKITPSPHTRICRQHWPSGDISWVKKRRFARPRDPPSVFDAPRTFHRQTAPSTSRSITERNISLEIRGAKADELQGFLDRDKIGEWDNFLTKLISFCENHSLVLRKVGNFIKLYYLNESDKVDFVIEIFETFNVCVKYCGVTISVRDLLSFQHHLEMWTQLEAIVNRAKQYEPPVQARLDEAVSHLKSVVQRNECDAKIMFLIEQLELSSLTPPQRRYTSLSTKIATEILLSSRAAYKMLREYLALPHPDTLKSKMGSLKGLGSLNDARNTISTVFSQLTGLQKVCVILFDEIYVKPSIRFRGNHVFGYAEDSPSKPARTVLVLMIRPLMGADSFVVRLIPVFTLTAEFLYSQLLPLINLITECGGRALSLMCDSLSTNRKCYKLFRQNFSKDVSKPWKVPHPSLPSRDLFLMFDPTHLFKNIRNNWITEANKQLSLTVPGSERMVIGSWKDVEDLYNSEKDNILKQTRLTKSACYPSSIERQKVSLVMKVFNEKTVAALVNSGKKGTAEFIDCILRMWKILNVKCPNLDVRLNDPDRQPISSGKHQNLQYLTDMAKSVEKMPGGRGAKRIMSLTNETKTSLDQTLNGIVEMSTQLLQDKALTYVLLGTFQSDRLEGEFGVYRQLSGGCYYISVEQILCSTKLWRLKLYTDLEVEPPAGHTSICCTSDFTEPELLAMDCALLSTSDDISENEMAALFYVCGYISFKENLSGKDTNTVLDQSSEFTSLVSRGKLSIPPQDLLKFAIVCYTFFKTLKSDCANRMIRVFLVLYESSFETFSNPENCCRRMVNTFFRGLTNLEDDKTQRDKEASRKIKKLTSLAT